MHMLGEQVGESTGQVSGIRVLPLSSTGEIRTESSFVGAGRLLGVEVTDIGTFVQTMRSDGVLHVEEGIVVMTGAGGQVASLSGFALGKPLGNGQSAHFASCGVIRTTAEAWKRLNGVAIVSEYDVDAQGRFTVRVWEWK
jgi:hypothetical protein